MTDNDHLVQTRLCQADFSWLKSRAQFEGYSLAAFLRQLVRRERRRSSLARGRRGWKE